MNIQEAKTAIGACDLCDQVPLLVGAHGIGKSEIMKQYATENNYHCEILMLSLLDTADLCGIPRTATVGGQSATIWAAPQWFVNIINAAWANELHTKDLVFQDNDFKELVLSRHKGEVSRGDLNDLYCSHYDVVNDGLKLHIQDKVSWKHSKRSILLLDEYNRSASDVRNATMQLILDKTLNSHLLPWIEGKPTMIVAAINPSDSGDYTVEDIDPAQADRFVEMHLEADISAWLDYARKTNVAPVVRDFLSEHPNRLHFTSADGKSGSSPRAWTSLARTMAKIDQIPTEVQFQLMKGIIGQELASQFLSYYNNYFKVIKMDDIEIFMTKKNKTTKDPKKIGKAVNKLIKDQEVIQKQELAEQFWDKYASSIDEKNPANSLPLISFLEGLDLEILNSFLKSKKTDDATNYMNMAKVNALLDPDGKKSILLKVVSKVQQ